MIHLKPTKPKALPELKLKGRFGTISRSPDERISEEKEEEVEPLSMPIQNPKKTRAQLFAK